MYPGTRKKINKCGDLGFEDGGAQYREQLQQVCQADWANLVKRVRTEMRERNKKKKVGKCYTHEVYDRG